MVIKLSCWNVGKQSANLARLHTMCGSGAELSRAEISRAKGSGRRYGGGAPVRAVAPALLPIATADPCSGGGNRRSLKERNPHFLWAGCAKPVLCLGTRYWGRGLIGQPGNP